VVGENLHAAPDSGDGQEKPECPLMSQNGFVASFYLTTRYGSQLFASVNTAMMAMVAESQGLG